MKESLNNRVEVQTVRGRNRVTDLVYASPFRIFQLGQGKGKEPVKLMLSNYGGGMLQGDRVHLDIRCGRESGLLLQSQANSQVFRNDNGKDAYFEVSAQLEKGSQVVIAPEPVVLHKDARYHQKQNWNLEEGAKLILVDWMQSGRSDSGESFQFNKYLSELEISRKGKVILKDRFRCLPHQDNPNSYASFMGLDHVVNLFYIGYESLPEGFEVFRNREITRIHPLQDRKPAKPQSLYCAAVPLSQGEGWSVRLLGKTRLDLEPVLACFL